ncbi:hypothetical protein ACFPRL_16295 [Pseudoclavibacter helvolus]
MRCAPRQVKNQRPSVQHLFPSPRLDVTSHVQRGEPCYQAGYETRQVASCAEVTKFHVKRKVCVV